MEECRHHQNGKTCGSDNTEVSNQVAGVNRSCSNPKCNHYHEIILSTQKTTKETNDDSQFTGCVRNPTEGEGKKLLGLMAASALDQCMNGHFYTIGGNIRRHGKGGAIGSDLIGELARVYMLQWNQRFLERCKSLGIHLDI